MMDAFELNKIAGAVLFALLILFGTKTATDLFFKAHAPEKPGYDVAVTEGTGDSAGQAEKEEVALAVLLAEGDAAKGEKVANKCKACHTFDKGGANRIGPNLYGIVGRELGTVDGFAYSGALKGKGGSWGYDELDEFIANPKGFINGTKMAFAGIRRPNQRADLILYLRQQGDDKPALPEPEAKAEEKPEEKKEEAKSDGGEAAAPEKKQ
ncbi:MAG: cytochrome c family protein [Hyphomicrobiaceae bacterium]|nr:cytochrome c family protein [Hyphomicrobiaceae bacterium]